HYECDLQAPVAQQHFVGGLRLAAQVHQVKIAEEAVKNEGNGEHHRVVIRQVLGGEGVERVGRAGRRDDDVHHVVEEREAVFVEDGAVIAGVALQQGDLA